MPRVSGGPERWRIAARGDRNGPIVLLAAVPQSVYG